jgi:hypothetical protein
MFWRGQFIRRLEMLFETVSNEHNRKYMLAISAMEKSEKNYEYFSGYFCG